MYGKSKVIPFETTLCYMKEELYFAVISKSECVISKSKNT